MIEDLTVCYSTELYVSEQSFDWILSLFVQQSFEDAEKKKKDDVEEEGKPDPLTQLVTTFCLGAMTERSGALQEDLLYMSYAQIAAKSCGEEEEEGGDEEGGEDGEGGASIHVSEFCFHKFKANVYGFASIPFAFHNKALNG